MSLKMTFQLISPERVVFEGEVEKVTVNTTSGQITILPNHLPLVSTIEAGELLVTQQGKTYPLAIAGGFVEVRKPNTVLIMADSAEKVEEIDEQRAEEARRRAAELRQSKQVESEDFAYLSAKIEKELTRLKLKRKYRQQTGPRAPESSG